MKEYKFNEEFPFEVVDVNKKLYMFTNMRVDRDSIPEGLYAYDVGDDCDGEFWRIQKFVLVNHWGTIIGKDEVPLGEDGAYWCDPSPENDNISSEGTYPFADPVHSLEEYMALAEEYEKNMREED